MNETVYKCDECRQGFASRSSFINIEVRAADFGSSHVRVDKEVCSRKCRDAALLKIVKRADPEQALSDERDDQPQLAAMLDETKKRCAQLEAQLEAARNMQVSAVLKAIEVAQYRRPPESHIADALTGAALKLEGLLLRVLSGSGQR